MYFMLHVNEIHARQFSWFTVQQLIQNMNSSHAATIAETDLSHNERESNKTPKKQKKTIRPNP